MADGVQGPQMPQASAPKPVEPQVKPTPAPAAAVPANKQNVFTELFGESQAGDDKLMNAVTQQSEKSGRSFFGQKPALDAVKSEPKLGSKKVKRAKPGALMLQVVFLLLILGSFYFYTQNAAGFSVFGTNPAQRSLLAEEQVRGLQAEIDVQNHLAAVLLLDQWSTQADAYLFNVNQSTSSYNSQNKKTEFATEAARLETSLLSQLAEVQSHLKPTVSDIPAAKEVIDGLILGLQSKRGEVDEQSLLQDIQDLESAKVLLQSKDFKNFILGLDPNAVSDADIESIFLAYSKINQSVSSIISSIQSNRVNWAFYFSELEKLTKAVDPLFNTEFQGTLVLNNVSFNRNGVSVNGKTSTDDTKNFTLVSDLIDTYESAVHFENVEDRSYAKREGDTEYTGDFSINLGLILNPEDNE